MKTTFSCLSMVLLAACSGLSGDKPSPGIAIAMVVDFTDPKKLWPSAGTTLPLFHLETTPDIEASLHISPITNLQTTPLFSAHLPDVATTNSHNVTDDPQYRSRSVLQFYTEAKQSFTQLYNQFDSSKSLTYSECYISICRQLEWLASVNGTRYLLIFSDLAEKSSAFNAYTNLKNLTIETVVKKLQAYYPLPPNLQGIHVVFCYQPINRVDDMRFNTMAAAYKKLLEAKGASIEVTSTIKTSAP